MYKAERSPFEEPYLYGVPNIITKDGHTMFLQDVARELNNNARRIKQLEEQLNEATRKEQE